MLKRTSITRTLATVLALLVPLVSLPVSADTARLAGTVYSAADDSPLAGVRVYAADPDTGRIYPSPPTAVDGSFEIPGLPAGNFELGVAIGQGLFLIKSPVTLGAAQNQQLIISVRDQDIDPARLSGTEAVSETARGAKAGVWNNPVTAALIVVGAALVLGLLIEAATDDDDEPATSPF